ncbi:MAG: hypothetical protein ABJF01_25995, partial [bacterium]
GAGFRTVALELVDITCLTWSPNSQSLLVHGRLDPAFEPDWWAVPIDGGAPANSRLVQRVREAGMYALPTAPAWLADCLIFSAAGPQGLRLHRQRLVASTLQPAGSLEPFAFGGDAAQLPMVAGRRVAFLSNREDVNLWSVALDTNSGTAIGPMQRMTRGAGILNYLSLAKDYRTLAYFSVGRGGGNVFLRDLETGSERMLVEGPDGEKGYPAISPDGVQIAFGQRRDGERAARPIFIAHTSDSSWRTLGDDCGGRPRQWVDERWLTIERYARLNSIALIDTESGEQRELLQSAEWSIKNARVSPDGRWVAFDAARPGEPVHVFVAAFRDSVIPESEWGIVDHPASHPFWSADGRLLYYTPVGTNALVRRTICARQFSLESGCVAGEPTPVHSFADMAMPVYLPGTAPIATPDRMMFVLGDLRGDIWLMDL